MISHPTCLLGQFFLHLLFSEPIGGSIPKFSGVTHLTGLLGQSNTPLTLTCPAQGSPVPGYRCVVFKIHFMNYTFPQLKGCPAHISSKYLRTFFSPRTNWGLCTQGDSALQALSDDLQVPGVLVPLLPRPGIPLATV